MAAGATELSSGTACLSWNFSLSLSLHSVLSSEDSMLGREVALALLREIGMKLIDDAGSKRPSSSTHPNSKSLHHPHRTKEADTIKITSGFIYCSIHWNLQLHEYYRSQQSGIKT
jgi:hypothetical protein